MAQWYSLEEAREAWAGAPMDDYVLLGLLDASKEAVLAYAPERYSPSDEDPDPDITEGIRQAHLLQARNIWNAVRVDPAGQYGTETFQVAAFPLDWQVKQLIRPKRAIPVVG